MDLQLNDWIQKKSETQGIVIDLRTSVEQEEGFLEEALHMDFYDAHQFVTQLNDLDKSKSYFLYCQSGSRGRQACIVMKKYGFQKVYNLIDGYSNFKKD